MTTIRLKYMHAFVDRHGRARHYFRHQGKRWPLPAPGEQGFTAAYEACKARIVTNPAPVARVAFLPGSLGWAIEKFLASDDYRARAEATKTGDRRLLDELRRHAGAGMLRDLKDRHVKAIRDHFRTTFSTSTADAAIARLSVIWNFADEHLAVDIGANPTAGIRPFIRARLSASHGRRRSSPRSRKTPCRRCGLPSRCCSIPASAARM
jgi:hypothetical protein